MFDFRQFGKPLLYCKPKLKLSQMLVNLLLTETKTQIILKVNVYIQAIILFLDMQILGEKQIFKGPRKYTIGQTCKTEQQLVQVTLTQSFNEGLFSLINCQAEPKLQLQLG